jgi:hypothetical protein
MFLDQKIRRLERASRQAVRAQEGLEAGRELLRRLEEQTDIAEGEHSEALEEAITDLKLEGPYEMNGWRYDISNRNGEPVITKVRIEENDQQVSGSTEGFCSRN